MRPVKGRNGGTLMVMEKGETLNPHGRARKLVHQTNIDLEQMGVKEVTMADIRSCYLRLINLTTAELETMRDDPDESALVRVVAKNLLLKGGFEILERMLDRSLGRATGKLEIGGSGSPIALSWMKP